MIKVAAKIAKFEVIPSAVKAYRHLEPSITAVNTFRLTLACLEGRAPEFVDNRFFLSSYKTFRVRPYTGPDGAAQ